jgi:hypothetical protein
MKPIVLILAALVFPLVWGYLSEQILRRIWPHRMQASRTDKHDPNNKKTQPTQFPDYQI